VTTPTSAGGEQSAEQRPPEHPGRHEAGGDGGGAHERLAEVAGHGDFDGSGALPVPATRMVDPGLGIVLPAPHNPGSRMDHRAERER
jgi:hypothetical protein